MKKYLTLGRVPFLAHLYNMCRHKQNAHTVFKISDACRRHV